MRLERFTLRDAREVGKFLQWVDVYINPEMVQGLEPITQPGGERDAEGYLTDEDGYRIEEEECTRVIMNDGRRIDLVERIASVAERLQFPRK